MTTGSGRRGAPPIARRRFELSLAIVAIAVGSLLRLSLAFQYRSFGNAEAGNLVHALADGRGFADALFAGEGPTDHLLPIAPFVAGMIYRILGTQAAGHAAIAVWALCVTAACFALAAYCLRLAGASERVSVAAFAVLWLLPIHCFTEAVRWQVWDGGLSTALALGCLAIVLSGEKRAEPTRRFVWGKAVLPAAAFIVNPIMGLAAGAVSALSTLRHRERDGVVKPLALALACVAIVVTPWLVRNDREMGYPVPLRDNFGLELAISNYDGAVDPQNPRAEMKARMAQVHPFEHPAAQRALIAAGGEVAYSRKLQALTLAWMASHPGSVVRVWWRHLGEMLFPQPWMFDAEHEVDPALKSCAAIIVSVLAIASLTMRIASKNAVFVNLTLVAFCAVPVVLTIPFQPTVRYGWVIYPLTACLAVELIERMMQAMIGRVGLTPTGADLEERAF